MKQNNVKQSNKAPFQNFQIKAKKRNSLFLLMSCNDKNDGHENVEIYPFGVGRTEVSNKSKINILKVYVERKKNINRQLRKIYLNLHTSTVMKNVLSIFQQYTQTTEQIFGVQRS